MPSVQQPAKSRCVQQVRVIGMAYGAWGVRQYGNKPHKEDALTFYIRHLQVRSKKTRAPNQNKLVQADKTSFKPLQSSAQLAPGHIEPKTQRKLNNTKNDIRLLLVWCISLACGMAAGTHLDPGLHGWTAGTAEIPHCPSQCRLLHDGKRSKRSKKGQGKRGTACQPAVAQLSSESKQNLTIGAACRLWCRTSGSSRRPARLTQSACYPPPLFLSAADEPR